MSTWQYEKIAAKLKQAIVDDLRKDVCICAWKYKYSLLKEKTVSPVTFMALHSLLLRQKWQRGRALSFGFSDVWWHCEEIWLSPWAPPEGMHASWSMFTRL